MDAIAEFLERVGPGVGLMILILLPTLAIARTLSNSRAKMTEALAAKETAEAQSVSGMSQIAMHFMQVQSETLKTMAASHQQYNQTLETLMQMIDRIGHNYSERGLMIIEQMELSNAALQGVIGSAAAAQASAAVAAENASLVQVAMGGVVTTGADILLGIAELTRKFTLLTVTIESQGEVDDTLRNDILAQMSRLNAYLTRKEATENEDQKEKSDESPKNETVSHFTGVLTLGSTDNPGADAGVADTRPIPNPIVERGAADQPGGNGDRVDSSSSRPSDGGHNNGNS